MRSIPKVAATCGLVALLTLAGCSSKPGDDASASPTPLGGKATLSVDAKTLPTVSGEAGTAPTITYPLKKGASSPSPTPTPTETAAPESPSPSASAEPSPYIDPPKKLQVEAVDGFTATGDAIKADNVVAVNATAFVWGQLEALPYFPYSTTPFVFPVRNDDPRWTSLSKAVVGQKIGTRVMAVIPGSEGGLNTTLGAEAGDTLTVVMDILAQYPQNAEAPKDAVKTDAKTGPVVTGALGAAAKITVPGSAKAPEKVTTTVLATGKGNPIADGDTLVYNYAAVDWNGDDGGSTWVAKRGPASILVSSVNGDGTVTAFSGLVGVPLGSRVLVELPAKKNAYAAEAIVMDLIAVAPNSLAPAPSASASASPDK